MRIRLLGLAILLIATMPVLAQENRICFVCHKKEDLTGEVGGKEVSIFVDRKGYEASVHGALACGKCHLDVDPEDLPHEEELATVDCSSCHPEEADLQRQSIHGLAAARGDPLAPTCVHCHGKHNVRKKTDRDSRTHILKIPILCGECHHEGTDVSLERDIPQDRILENYSQSLHGEGLYRTGLIVTAVCTSCHTSHFILPHTDPRSSVHPNHVADTCTSCHGLIGQVHQKVIEGHDWETKDHKIPACVDCHAPHRPRPDKPDDDERLQRTAFKTGTGDCLDCHYGPGSDVAGPVDKPAYLRSMHRSVECAQCHTDVTPVTQMTPDRTRACDSSSGKVDCSACHEEAIEYATSTHGDLHAKGDPDAPACLDCHAKHATRSKKLPTSPTFPRNVPNLCARCHREGEKAAVRIHADVADIVGSYRDSIHGKGLVESGLVVTATCSSCHGAHGGLPPDNPKSRVHRDNVADTCGECHHGIEEKFKKSVHWSEAGNGDEDLPSCADCHSSHTITRTDQSNFRFHMMDQCGRCHTEEAGTFFDTIHGKKTELESADAAKCYDCHGTHNILPIADPDSTLSRRNIVGTCAQCHDNAHERFTGYLTHATHHDQDKYPYLYWTFWGMTVLLVGTLALAFLHTGAWLTRLWLTKEEWKKRHKVAPGEKLYRRFGKLQRTMHLFMLLSFFTLALTGMSLKFSYMGWAQVVSSVLGGDQSMALLHRMGAITLLVVLCLHIWDIRRKRRQSGRTLLQMIRGPDSILFQWKDLKEFGQSIKWFLGLGPRPKYGRYTYWEKFDYFAVFWGILVIGMSGLMLWFPVFFTRLVPGWFLNVATIIHSDEALLAVGFIFTIHFFNTHFRPDKFPMDPVIFTGRVPVEEFKQDKPREYERLVASGELEKHLVDPFPKPAERAAKIFGFVFLGIGLTIIGLIVYSMIFGYR